jgi:hypothetical protein
MHFLVQNFESFYFKKNEVTNPPGNASYSPPLVGIKAGANNKDYRYDLKGYVRKAMKGRLFNNGIQHCFELQ